MSEFALAKCELLSRCEPATVDSLTDALLLSREQHAQTCLAESGEDIP